MSPAPEIERLAASPAFLEKQRPDIREKELRVDEVEPPTLTRRHAAAIRVGD